MIKQVVLNISQVAEKYRLVIWILLLLLTTAVLLFPTQLKYEFSPVQSPYIFGDNLPLFAALYCVWMLLLLVLIFSRKEAKWEKLALVCIFAVVFLGFWAIITPYFRHQDEWYRAAHIQYLLDYGKINLSAQYLEYFDFPGLQLLGSAICQVTGLSIFVMRTVLVLFMAVLFSALLYVLFLKSLKNASIAAIGVILVLLGNIMISKACLLFSSFLGLLFIPLLLILLNRNEHALLETWHNRSLIIIVLLAATITHFVTSIALVLILAGIYLVQKIDKRIPLISPGLVALSIVIFLMWQTYWAIRTFTGIIGPIPELFSGGFTLSALFLGAGAAIGSMGGGVPLWALITKLSWWGFIYGFGSILWMKWFFRLKTMSALEKKCAGGLAGIIMLAIIATLIGAQGYQGAIRYLMYAPFFIVPIILAYLFNLRDNWRRYSIALLAIILFTLSLPTFFVNNDMIEVDAVYPTEISSREFLRSSYGEGEDLTVTSTLFSSPLIIYYLPKAELKTEPNYLYFVDKADLWVSISNLSREFAGSVGGRSYNVFIYSKRLIGAHEHMLGFKPTHPEWLKLENTLSSTANRIYSNGDVQLFVRRR